MDEIQKLPTLTLTGAEAESPPIQKLIKYLEERIDLHRKKNDADLVSERTASLRGQIREDKTLIQVLKGKPEIPEDKTKK